MPDSRVHLKHIAEAAGVSIATVSNALNGTGRIALATQERIRGIARKLGYQPDPIMQALCHYRQKTGQGKMTHQTIAFVIPVESTLAGDRRIASDRLLEGIRAAGGELAINIEVFPYDGAAATTRQLSRILYNRGIKGVILSFPRPYERERPNELEWDKFAVVACKPMFAQDRFHSVSTDHFSNGRTLFRKLHAWGFERIGLCIDEVNDIMANRAFKAGLWAEQQKHIPADQQIPGLIMPNWDFALFADWFKRWEPRVIVSQNKELIRWIVLLGYRVPQDVGIVVPSTAQGYSNSGIDQNFTLMGREAVRLLWEKLIPTGSYGIPAFPLKIIIPCTWNDGITLLYPKSAGKMAAVESALL